jgi:hypothetical protein
MDKEVSLLNVLSMARQCLKKVSNSLKSLKKFRISKDVRYRGETFSGTQLHTLLFPQLPCGQPILLTNESTQVARVLSGG